MRKTFAWIGNSPLRLLGGLRSSAPAPALTGGTISGAAMTFGRDSVNINIQAVDAVTTLTLSNLALANSDISHAPRFNSPTARSR